MSAATQNEMKRLVRATRAQAELLERVWDYVDEQGLAKLGQSKVTALIEAHQQAVDERDALSAHVERQAELLARLVAAMRAYEMDVDSDFPPPRDHRAMMSDAEAALDATPGASLARLKAVWQASALEVAVITAQMKGQTEVASWLQDLADTCRLQDEEPSP